MKLRVLSVGLCALQDGGKSYEGILGFRKALIAAECVWSYCEEDFAPMSEIFGHHFQKGTGVHRVAVGLADRHR